MTPSSLSPSPPPKPSTMFHSPLSLSTASTLEPANKPSLEKYKRVPNPTTRRWPHVFSLSKVVDGLESMKERMVNGERQNNAFMQTFGIKCVHETLHQKWAILASAQKEKWGTDDYFINKGDGDDACWVFFEARVTGKKIRGKDVNEKEDGGIMDDRTDCVRDLACMDVSPTPIDESDIEDHDNDMENIPDSDISNRWRVHALRPKLAVTAITMTPKAA
ncbi:hypothetical protein K439DRAFT_1613136 [Ramaria rubella]|nr:hypothetical protein K439DRAFT_1613136 [Ramaria rubella]